MLVFVFLLRFSQLKSSIDIIFIDMGVFLVGWDVIVEKRRRRRKRRRRKKTQKKNGARDLVSDRVMAAHHTRCAAAGPKSVERAESDVRSARVDVWTTIIIDGVDWCVTRTNKSDIIRGR